MSYTILAHVSNVDKETKNNELHCVSILAHKNNVDKETTASYLHTTVRKI